MYEILLILGLIIGAVFMTVLLVGDRRDAIDKAKRKALEDSIAAAGKDEEGNWPPPPSYRTIPLPSSTVRKRMSLAEYYAWSRASYIVFMVVVFVMPLSIAMIHWMFPKLEYVYLLGLGALIAAVTIRLWIGVRRR